jgi:hypothetical protein
VKRPGTGPHGQSLVELALVLPLFTLLLAGIFTFGIGIFYQQQITNAAREAARYAAIHSATSQCPTTSWRDPNLSRLPDDFDLGNYFNCDPADLGWPEMSAHAREKLFGLNAGQVHFAACWSGYWDDAPSGWDAAPLALDGTPNQFHDCTIGGIDPREDESSLPCPPPSTTLADDQASDLAASTAGSANQVTVYACYDWHPPAGGVGFPIPCGSSGWCHVEIVPATVTIRAVITEAMQHQQ